VVGLRGYHKIAPFQKQDDWMTLECADSNYVRGFLPSVSRIGMSG